MDANEHVLHGQFCRRLTSADVGLDIEEMSHQAWDQNHEPNTFADGSKLIDGVWASHSLEIRGFKILSFGESVSNHSTMVFDVSTQCLVGKFEQRIVRPACRRLNCKTSSLSKYNRILERLMGIHKMEERLDEIIEAIVDDKPTPT